MGALAEGKLRSLTEAVAMIPDGAVVALGGNTFHRAPLAAVHELVRQGTGRLTLVKTAGAYDVDVLIGAGAVSELWAAYVGFETLGLAPQFRRTLESGQITLWEHT